MRSIFLFGVLLFSFQSLATSFYQPPFPQAVQQTERIVRGRVLGSEPAWAIGPDGNRRIYTFIELDLDEALKGEFGGRTLRVRELGGAIGKVGLQVPGTAKFSEGEDVVLFLGRKNSDDSYDLRGLMMGKYEVRRDESGNEFLLGPGLRAGRVEAGHAHEHSPGDDDRWTIDRLRELISEQAKKAETTGALISSSDAQVEEPVKILSPSKTDQENIEIDKIEKIDSSQERSGLGIGIKLVFSVIAVFCLIFVFRKIFKRPK